MVEMKRVWHHYLKWEEYHWGMWRRVSREEVVLFLRYAYEFTGNATLYGRYMREVLRMWPVSCEHNLTDTTCNRKAWLGHAACCVAFRCPEYIVRMAWGRLTEKQRQEANEQAHMAIEEWEERYLNEQQASGT